MWKSCGVTRNKFCINPLRCGRLFVPAAETTNIIHSLIKYFLEMRLKYRRQREIILVQDRPKEGILPVSF